jgi:hypothetical protein
MATARAERDDDVRTGPVICAPDSAGPWFVSAFYGTCSDCGDAIVPSCPVRADGTGRYQCEACGVLTDTAYVNRVVSGGGGNSS